MTFALVDLLLIVLFFGSLALTVRSAIRAQGWRLLILLILPALSLADLALPRLHRSDAPFALPDHRTSLTYVYVSLAVFLVTLALSGMLYARLKGARAFAGVIIAATFLLNLGLLFAINAGY